MLVSGRHVLSAVWPPLFESHWWRFSMWPFNACRRKTSQQMWPVLTQDPSCQPVWFDEGSFDEHAAFTMNDLVDVYDGAENPLEVCWSRHLDDLIYLFLDRVSAGGPRQIIHGNVLPLAPAWSSMLLSNQKTPVHMCRHFLPTKVVWMPLGFVRYHICVDAQLLLDTCIQHWSNIRSHLGPSLFQHTL